MRRTSSNGCTRCFLMPRAYPGGLLINCRHQPMLFVGCEIPDWIGRFLLRLSSTERLSDERKQFFFVGTSDSQVPSLSDFFATYCRRPLVQELEMEPAAFVSELRERCANTRRRDATGPSAQASRWLPLARMGRPHRRSSSATCVRMRRPPGDWHTRSASSAGTVWLDARRIEAGDDWEKETLTAIGETVRLFVPIISANTEREREGYVFREWAEAVERSPENFQWPLHRAGDHRRRLRG